MASVSQWDSLDPLEERSASHSTFLILKEITEALIKSEQTHSAARAEFLIDQPPREEVEARQA